MPVIPLTIFISVALAALFTVLFWREQARRGRGCAERDSLLPLADEQPVPHGPPPDGAAPSAAEPHAGHDDGCGCRSGRRPACAGCLRHSPVPR